MIREKIVKRDCQKMKGEGSQKGSECQKGRWCVKGEGDVRSDIFRDNLGMGI